VDVGAAELEEVGMLEVEGGAELVELGAADEELLGYELDDAAAELEEGSMLELDGAAELDALVELCAAEEKELLELEYVEEAAVDDVELGRLELEDGGVAAAGQYCASM